MNQETFRRVSAWIRRFRYGEKIVINGNRFLTDFIYVFFAILLMELFINKDERIIQVLSVTGISFVAVSIFRHIYNADRPYIVYDFSPIIKKEKAGESMPSRHVFSAFIIAMAALYIYPMSSIPVFICSVLMCFGRVVAGVHFPKDVIVGAVIGIICGYAGFFM